MYARERIMTIFKYITVCIQILYPEEEWTLHSREGWSQKKLNAVKDFMSAQKLLL